MFRTTSAAAMMVLLAWAVPAFGDLHTFQIDEDQSYVEFLGGLAGSGLEGTFQLDLTGSSPDWNGEVAMVGVNAWNLDLIDILSTFTINPGNLQIQNFGSGVEKDSGPLEGGPPVASGRVNTDFYLYVDFVQEDEDTIDDWQDRFDWDIEVSDDDYIGSKEPGWTPEARLFLEGSIGSALGPIPFEVVLVGAEVPEPGTLTLLLGGMLMVLPLAWRRRRRA